MRVLITISTIVLSFLFIACTGGNSKKEKKESHKPYITDNTKASVQKIYKVNNDSIIIKNLLENGVVENHKLFAINVLHDFYKNRDYQVAWMRKNNIDQALQAISDMHYDGLNPEDYHYSLLRDKAKQFSQTKTINSSEFAKFDILLSDAVITANMHLISGKVDPESLKRKWHVNEKNHKGRYAGEAKALEKALVQENIVEEFNSLKPKHFMYTGLKKALTEYREYKDKGGWNPINLGETLKLNDKSIRVKQLRSRLLATNDMDKYKGANDSVYDAALFEQVKRAQKKYGIHPDGNVGKETLKELNVSVEHRIEQIKANLERARWILYDLKDKYIAVNIAAFELYFIDDNKEILKSRVIVGKDHTKTTIFKGTMKYIVINPTWNVPRSLYDGYINKLKHNPGYFSKKNMEVVTTSGKPVAIAGKDWNNYTLHNFPYMFRQKSGPSNALGYIKCMFPNKYSIYIHDTPSRSLFDKDKRTFSHGCIRTKKIRNVAELLLQPNHDGWNQEKISKIIKGGKTTTVSLKEHIPVLIIYWTSGVDLDNNFYFKPDIYQRDGELIKALNKNFEK